MWLFNTRLSKLLFLLLLAIPLAAQDNITARRPFGQHTVTFSATPTFDAGTTDSFKITLTANVTSSTLIGAEAGHTYTFDICQDATGGRTFVWPSQMVGPIAILSGANVCTQEIFVFDGTSAINPTTATSGGGGSGTVNAGTTGQITYYGASGTTVSGNAKLDEGFTTANTLTYTGTGGISAQTFNAAGSGAMSLIGTEGTCAGAAAGKTVLCLGDNVSHSAQVSNNGDSFRPAAVHQSTSPVPHGIMLAETFPQMQAASRGTQGQPFLEGSGAADPGYGQLDLSISTNVINRLAKANQTASTVYNDQANTLTAAGTLDASASTVASALRSPNGAGLTTAINGAIGYDTTNNLFHGGLNSADSRFVSTTITPTDTFCAQWTRTSGHYELGQASGTCGTPGGAGALSGITAATGANSINNGDNAQTWNALLTTAGKHWFTITENSASTATGTPYLFDIHSIASSTANPLVVTALGTANGWNLLNSGALWAPVGTGALAIPGTAHGTVVSEGGSTATVVVAPGTAGQVLISNGASADPAYADPVVSQATASNLNAQVVGNVASAATDSGNPVKVGGIFNTTQPTVTNGQRVDSQSTARGAAIVSTGVDTFHVTVDSAAANASTNTVQLNGTTIDTNSGNKSAGTQRVVIATDQPNLTTALNVALAANQSVNNAQVSGTAVSVNNGTVDAGTQRVTLASDSTGQVVPAPTTASGDAVSACNILSAASTNSTNCKGSAGNFYGYEIFNTTTTIYYLRLYNSSAAPTCSSATGFIRTIPIPPAGASGQAGGAVSNQVFPVNFGTGIGYCITGGSSSTDNTNAATGVFGEIRYK